MCTENGWSPNPADLNCTLGGVRLLHSLFSRLALLSLPPRSPPPPSPHLLFLLKLVQVATYGLAKFILRHHAIQVTGDPSYQMI